MATLADACLAAYLRSAQLDEAALPFLVASAAELRESNPSLSARLLGSLCTLVPRYVDGPKKGASVGAARDCAEDAALVARRALVRVQIEGAFDTALALLRGGAQGGDRGALLALAGMRLTATRLEVLAAPLERRTEGWRALLLAALSVSALAEGPCKLPLVALCAEAWMLTQEPYSAIQVDALPCLPYPS